MARYKFNDFAINLTKKKVPEESDYPLYIGLEHMDSGCIHVNRWGSDVPIIGEKLIMHKGDVLLGKRNAYLRRAAIAPHDGIFSAHGMILRPKEDIVDYDYFVLLIASDYFFDEAIKISVGSLSPTINWKDLKEVEFYLPPLSKQKEIAKTLWSINNTIESYQKMIDLSDKLIRAKFIEMFGGIGKNSLYGNETFGDLCNYKSSNIQINKLSNVNGQYPLYGASGEIKKLNFFNSNDDYVAIVKDGAGVGRVFKCSGRSSVVGTLAYLYPKENCTLDYLEQLLIFMDLGGSSTGATIPHIYFKDYSKTNVPIPPINKQNEFSNFVEKIEKVNVDLKEKQLILKNMYKKMTNEFMKEN